MNDNNRNRQSIRLKGYDYTRPGAYFVTLVTWQRQCRFGEIIDGRVRLGNGGTIAETTWLRLPAFFPIRLGTWVIMPNHFHAIVWIEERQIIESSFTEQNGTIFRPSASPDKPISGAMGAGERLYGRSAGPVEYGSGNAMGAGASPQQSGTMPVSLGAIIQNFKSTCTLKINRVLGTRGMPVWQRNYYERIIRDEQELQRIARYIEANPSNWETDSEFPK